MCGKRVCEGEHIEGRKREVRKSHIFKISSINLECNMSVGLENAMMLSTRCAEVGYRGGLVIQTDESRGEVTHTSKTLDRNETQESQVLYIIYVHVMSLVRREAASTLSVCLSSAVLSYPIPSLYPCHPPTIHHPPHIPCNPSTSPPQPSTSRKKLQNKKKNSINHRPQPLKIHRTQRP